MYGKADFILFQQYRKLKSSNMTLAIYSQICYNQNIVLIHQTEHCL